MHIVAFVVLFILFMIVIGSAAWASFSAASWVPTWKKDLKRILDLANLKSGETLYDLGCGDGRILEYAAENYEIKEAVGFEISLIPYIFAKLRASFAQGHKKMRVVYGDLFRVNLKEVDVVVCFLMPAAIKKLKPKFEKSKTEKELAVFVYHR